MENTTRQLIGSKVIARIKDVARDDKGKIIPGKYTEIQGTIQYLGPNKYLNWPLQITIDGCPFKLEKVTDIIKVL